MQRAAYHGIGQGVVLASEFIFHFGHASWLPDRLNHVDRVFDEAIYEGVGEAIYAVYGEDDALSRDLIHDGVPPAFRDGCVRSYAQARAHFEGTP